MNECDILKWAAGANNHLPAFHGIDDDRILYLLGIDEEEVVAGIERHRLAHRFLQRFRQEKPGWCSRTLLSQIMDLGAQAERRFHQQLTALNEIHCSFTSRDRPSIILKGCAPYALSGDSRNIRQSYDIDLLVDEPENVEAKLRCLGYTGWRHTESEHEFASMRRGEVNIEIHRYFPVWSYPDGILSRDLTPAQHPGCWSQPYRNRLQRQIEYRDLLDHRAKGVTADSCYLTVTDANMCILILCAHEFRNYIEPPARRSTSMQLGVLASICDLTRHAQFDRHRFQALVDKHGGYDSVHYVGALLAAYFGSNPLAIAQRRLRRWRIPSMSYRRNAFSFPRTLTFFGGWASLNSAEELLLPLDTERIFSKLQANTVVATRGPQRRVYTVCSRGRGEPIDRVIVQSVSAERIPFEFSVSFDEEELTFNVRVLETKEGHDYCIDLRRDGLKWQGTQWGPWDGNDGHGTIELIETVCHFCVSFPWSVLPRSHQKTRSVSLTLTFTRWLTDPHSLWTTIVSTADPVVVVPLHIICE